MYQAKTYYNIAEKGKVVSNQESVKKGIELRFRDGY